MKLKYIVLSIILFIASAVAISLYYGNRKVNKFLNDYKKENPGVHFSAFDFSILNRSASMDSLVVNDSAKGIQLSIDKISLKNISLKAFLMNNQLNIGELSIQRPLINYTKKESTADTSESSAKTSRKIKLISIDKLIIQNGDLRYSDGENESKVWGITIETETLQQAIDSSINLNELVNGFQYCAFDSSSIGHIKQHTTTTNKGRISNGKIELQDLAIKTIKISEKTNFGKHDLLVKSIQADFKPLENLKSDQLLQIKKLAIEDVEFSTFKDKRYATNREKKPMPAELIQTIPFRIAIDSLKLGAKRIEYEERIEGSEKAGKVVFANLSATIANLTNDSASIASNKLMTASIYTQLMDKGDLYLSIYQDLQSSTGDHTIKGKLNSFDLTALNQAFVPLANVEFNSGQVNSFDFEFNASNHSSSGTADFKYDNLKVVFIGDKKIFKPSFLSKLETKLANAIVIRKANPLRGNFQEGKIEFSRDPSKSFLNFWWKSVFTGMKSSMIRL